MGRVYRVNVGCHLDADILNILLLKVFRLKDKGRSCLTTVNEIHLVLGRKIDVRSNCRHDALKRANWVALAIDVG